MAPFYKFCRASSFFRISRTGRPANLFTLDQWIEDYGEDSDFMRIRVRGEFPRSGSSQLIPPDLVAKARRSKARRSKAQGFEKLPIIMAADVARFGDDQTVIGMRQGRKFQILGKYRGLDTVQVAERIISFRDKHSPDAIVWWISSGTTVTARACSSSTVANAPATSTCTSIAAAKSGDSCATGSTTAVWKSLATRELEVDLTGPEYGFSSKNQIQLERKEDMKRRGLASPDPWRLLGHDVCRRHRLPQPEHTTIGLPLSLGERMDGILRRCKPVFLKMHMCILLASRRALLEISAFCVLV